MEKEKKISVGCGQNLDASRDYYIYLVCPVCHRSGWQLKEGLGLTREEILNMPWEFECPAHGLLREKPLHASPKATFFPEYMQVCANFIM